MVRIRLARVGLKRQPTYRIIVTDQRKARNGKEIEIIGHHNPRTRPSTDVVDEARALYWLSVGAQPSEAVHSIFKRTGTTDRFARLRAGESIEELAAEREQELAAAPPVSPKTKYPSPAPGEGKGPRAKERAAAAKAAAESAKTEEAPASAEEAAE
ncbi:MAG: 30S ribosomal protein S16 [Anaerolineaceae bacterium]|nr:MAG: 30S ribosomal protein S16 [Anaerolineaceae bacterium]